MKIICPEQVSIGLILNHVIYFGIFDSYEEFEETFLKFAKQYEELKIFL
jgi:hypothetical protein